MSQYRYETFADKHLSIVQRSGPEAMARCLFHDDGNASMQFNMEKGLFICFSGSCGARGTVKKIERELGLRVVEDELDISDIRRKLQLLKTEPTVELRPLPESVLDRYNFPTTYWTKIRGFSPATVKAFDLGADPLGEYVTIPIRNMQGELLGVIKRFFDSELKYKYPKGFKRSLNLFASWMVEQDVDAHTVVLVEGSVDAMKLWEAGYPAMAVYGSSLSATQVRILRRLGVQKVILFFDNDGPGHKATESCLGYKTHRRGYKGRVQTVTEYDPAADLTREFLVYVAEYRPGQFDPGDMSPSELDEAIANAYVPNTEFLRKKLSKFRKRR